VDNVIRVKDEFYVLATSALADDRTRVLKYGDTFAVLNRVGDIESVGLGEHGLYHAGMRHLSRLVLTLGNRPPQLLRSTLQGHKSFLSVDMMNVDIRRESELVVARGSLHMYRSKFLWHDVCYEQLRLSNFSLHRVETSVALEFGADFADIFQVRGAKRERVGESLPPTVGHDSVVLGYLGRDGQLRRTVLQFSPVPARLTQDGVKFLVSLQPKEEVTLNLAVGCDGEGAEPPMLSFDRASQETATAFEEQDHLFCRIHTSNSQFNAWLRRSQADLHMMIAGNPEGVYPYAGVPWFNTVFGRDGILTAMECLWMAPWIAKGVLAYLAENQATEVIPEEEAEPGKILHEVRRGEMANLREVPFRRYYGSVDTTPLFVMLAGAYLDRTEDHEFLETIWPNLLAALEWMKTFGDRDQDGFIEYEAQGQRGLVQQGWKDSHDSVFHQDGTLAEPPIALCEVQGYVYAAKRAAARMAVSLGHAALARKLSSEVRTLQERFERDFWDDSLGSYVLALDGNKKACRVRTSNPGHCLFSGIAGVEHATKLAHTLLSEELFCGWGIRTLGSREVRYNPVSYHNGSVWPHDNAIIARGLSRYGFKSAALSVFKGLFEASTFMELNRLPELFCGFHKRTDVEGPILYPVACSPQAWASAAVYLLLEACLGIETDPGQKCLRLLSPCLPDFLDELRIENLRLGDGSLDLAVRRQDQSVVAEWVRAKGGVKFELRN
jgi:glycogen debranching enzyme